MTAFPARRPGLTTLQAGRGLAALLVVLFHATGLFASESYWHTTILNGFFGFGHAGVEFFFALSGFIMILVHHDDIGKPHRIGNFAIKRIVRIYPIYWIVTAAALVLYYISGNSRFDLYLASLILIGRDNEAVLVVAWTLFHETAFYLLFIFLIFNRNFGKFLFLIWLVVCCAWIQNPIPPHYFLSPINIIFSFGMLAAIIRKRIPRPVFVMYTSIFIYLAIGIEEVYLDSLSKNLRTLLYGAISAIGIAAAVCAENKGSTAAPEWTVELGNASYSLYLVHYPVLAVIGQLWLATPLRSLPAFLAFCITIAAAICVGYLTHRVIEKPLMAVLGKWGRVACSPRKSLSQSGR